MWDIIKNFISFQKVIEKVFGLVRSNIYKKCIRLYQFNIFRAGFPDKILLYTTSMPTINVINYKKKCCIKAFAYVFFIFNESSIAGNIDIFKDLNVIQIQMKKHDPCWVDKMTIW